MVFAMRLPHTCSLSLCVGGIPSLRWCRARFKKKGSADEGIYAQVLNDVMSIVANKVSAAAAAATDNRAIMASTSTAATVGK